MQIYGSCASRQGAGVLVIGAAGSGKSDLVLRLLDRGFALVADDRVEIEQGIASPAERLAGLLEVRGLGVLRLPYAASARLALVVDLSAKPDRLPQPECHPVLRLPLVGLDPGLASAPQRVELALDCALGRLSQLAGAFAA